MAHTHLTAAYRPQLFAQVIGQEAVTRILSRAAAENKVAPAYMFSGTRGVGKTTVARILAKAINCSQGPGAEPCNACEFCRQITQGTSLDVVEIDGASHTGVDHVRKLTEDVSYAPLHCRYKVVIIDEAHQLSRSAFNALLKTLEEPPGHVSFILATTEPHKFPATIVSRCQHYVFKRVEQQILESHMAWVLDEQGVGYQPSALRILARKGAGSVRDCLSLLGQVLALGETEISAQAVQSLLGLAGQELMQDCVQALARQDSKAILYLVRNLLDQGLDIGFFLQDLGLVWRNLFILKQTGEEGISLLEMPEEEAREWMDKAGELSIRQIHAAWQMTLEGQKRVVASPDPALALELMLMNLAFLPQLMGMEQDQGRPGSASGKQSGGGQQNSRAGQTNRVQEPPASQNSSDVRSEDTQSNRDWSGFLHFVRSSQDKVLPNLHMVQGRLHGDRLELSCPGYMTQRLQDQNKMAWLKERVQEYFGSSLHIEICQIGGGNGREGQELKKKILNQPSVQEAIEKFSARVVEVQSLNQEDRDTHGKAWFETRS
ncbi:MAG: DNA polymerase III subunit gamma/tau [Desulfovermiculus sp.]|nr:DNA polymerase III subunit gamma/tau [Desulfovermiculus sp.]